MHSSLAKGHGEKGRYGPTTRLIHRKSSGPANWRKSTIKVSPCDHCAANDAAVRAKHWREKAQASHLENCWRLVRRSLEVMQRELLPGKHQMHIQTCFCLFTTWSILTTSSSSNRYQKLIDSFIKHLYIVKGTLVSRDDVLLYKVLAYLAIMRLDELGWQEFWRLCQSEIPVKLLPFIQAVFLEELTLRYAKEDWVKIYDGEFVSDLLRGLSIFTREAQQYAESLAEIVYGPDATLRYIPPPTTVIPFNLSVSNYTHPVTEEPEPFIYKAKPAPDWDKGWTLEMKRVSQVFKLNRVLLKEKYSDPRYQPFRLRTVERPTNLETIREEVEKKFQQEHEYLIAKSAPVPKMPEIEVKLTAAALLRENARFQKIIDSDRQKIDNLERELRDDTHLKVYEEEMRIQDEIEKALEIEFKKATVIASDQAARDAKKKHLCMNWAAASVVKEEKEKVHHEYALLVKNILFSNRFRHHLVKEEKKEVAVVKKKMWKENKQLVQEMIAESEDRLAVFALQRAREYQCKQELVRQLHFLEKESCYRIPKFDIYTTANHGCLEEMSIAELREALVQVKQWHKDEEERKHQDVMQHQLQRQKLLRDTARQVTRMRQVSRAQYLSRKAHERHEDVPEINAANQIGM